MTAAFGRWDKGPQPGQAHLQIPFPIPQRSNKKHQSSLGCQGRLNTDIKQSFQHWVIETRTSKAKNKLSRDRVAESSNLVEKVVGVVQ